MDLPSETRQLIYAVVAQVPKGRVATYGQIAELANDWDGYSGVIPKTSATVAEVLKNYGYHTGAWGK